jgi:hypothetical protein
MTSQVFEWADSFLNEAVPLANGTDWTSVTSLVVKDGKLELALQNPAQFAGYADKIILFRNNGLHIEIKYVSICGYEHRIALNVRF